MKQILALLSYLWIPSMLHAATDVIDGIPWTYTLENNTVILGNRSWGAPVIPFSTRGAITLPKSLGGHPVTHIGRYAFQGCTHLTSITLPEGITTIDTDAFKGCTQLTTVTLPQSLTTLGDGAFNDCSALTTLTLPQRLTTLGQGAFSGCSQLKTISLPKTVTTINAYTFYGCSALTTVTLPDTLTTIDAFAFVDCTHLTSITLPQSLTSIGICAFEGCKQLPSMILPQRLATLGQGAFSGCTAIDNIIFKGPPPNVKASRLSPFPPAKGYYLPTEAPLWKAFLNGPTGTWENLHMQPIPKDLLDQLQPPPPPTPPAEITPITFYVILAGTLLSGILLTLFLLKKK